MESKDITIPLQSESLGELGDNEEHIAAPSRPLGGMKTPDGASCSCAGCDGLVLRLQTNIGGADCEDKQTNWQNIVLLNAGGAKCEELSGQPDGRRRDPVQSPGNK